MRVQGARLRGREQGAMQRRACDKQQHVSAQASTSRALLVFSTCHGPPSSSATWPAFRPAAVRPGGATCLGCAAAAAPPQAAPLPCPAGGRELKQALASSNGVPGDVCGEALLAACCSQPASTGRRSALPSGPGARRRAARRCARLEPVAPQEVACPDFQSDDGAFRRGGVAVDQQLQAAGQRGRGSRDAPSGTPEAERPCCRAFANRWPRGDVGLPGPPQRNSRTHAEGHTHAAGWRATSHQTRGCACAGSRPCRAR